jgi:lipid-binding SYLF domain-containing protein
LELKGSTLNQDNGATKALYGKEIDAKDIMAGQVQSPAAAKPAIDVLNKYTPKGK